MDKEVIFDRIREARDALKPRHPDAATVNTLVTPGAAEQYEKEAARLFGRNPETHKILKPTNSADIIAAVRTAKTKATLRKRARAVRHHALTQLEMLLKALDILQRNNMWDTVELALTQSTFQAYIILARMMPSDYAGDWSPVRSRKGKKGSLQRLPEDWREQIAAKSQGQFRVPTLLVLMTGCRPSELQKGIVMELGSTGLYVTIPGAKVTAKAGQKLRNFRLADHPLTDELIAMMRQSETPTRMTVKVEHGVIPPFLTGVRSRVMRPWPAAVSG